jgi:hypothetical protein
MVNWFDVSVGCIYICQVSTECTGGQVARHATGLDSLYDVENEGGERD